MANNTLTTRILLCSGSTTEWASSSKVILKGEVALEFTTDTTQPPKVKIGDGAHTFAQLPYAVLTPSEIDTVIEEALKTFKSSIHTHANKAILDSIEVALTNALKANYDKAYAHSQSAHAPSNAEKNKINTVKVNGTALTPDDTRAVDISVPITGGDVTVNANHTMTVASVNASNVSGTLATGNIPNLDASKITGGTFATARIPNLDASKITSGTIAIARLPKAALDTLVKVADDTALYKLTKEQVQTGDSVYVTGTNKMYLVVDDTKLSSADGYQVYTAGAAATVDWAGVQNRPETFTGASASADGTGGLVPKPIKGDQNKYLRADGSFSQVQASQIGGIDANHRWTTDTEKTKWNNKYDAAIANTKTAGLVLAATGNNQVNVSSTGVMTVNSVSTDLLFNGTNTLILDGGSAS